LPVLAFRSPVATPYWVERESQPEPLETVCPAQVVAAGGVVVVAVLESPTLAEVRGGAVSYSGTARIVKSGILVVHISSMS
jgi:hypothetical protein